MRVAICDDSALFRGGLAALLATAGVDVVDQARTGQELVARLAEQAAAPSDDPLPDAVVVDIRMPPTFTDEGLRAGLQIRRRHPGVAVLVLSTYAETAYAATLLEACTGSVGYLLKDRVDDLDVLLDALTRVSRGETVVDPDIVRRLLERRRRDRSLLRLTDREREVLEQMALGRSNVGIAEQLHVGVKTVERHIAHLLQQLDLTPENVDHRTDNRRVLAVLTWLRSGGADLL